MCKAPSRAGLSHMSKEFEEELLLPCGEFHFASYGSIIGMSLQDVERDAAHDGKILWPVILARSGIILVEDNVEPPVQLVFYAPMRARDFERASGRQPLGQDHVVHCAGQLAVGVALGFDAADGGEIGKGRRVGRLGNDAGAAPFAPVVIGIALLVVGKLALGIGRGESGLGAGKQRSVIALELESIMRAALAHRCGHARMAMQGVGGDDTAFQNQGFQRRKRGRNLVAAGGVPGCERQPGLGIPDAHHERWHAAATTPLAGSSPRPARSALTKRAKVWAISSGSSRRNTRLKQSWLGGPWRRSTISASSASWAAAKSAISTQDFAPHKVAASAMNSIAARLCCAVKSRGSRTSRKIEMSVSSEALPNQESLLQNRLFLPAQ